MWIENLRSWLAANPQSGPWAIAGGIGVLALVVWTIAHSLIARTLVYVSKRTKNHYDDIVVEKIRPFRFSLIAPLLVIYYFSGLFAGGADAVREIVLFLILWLVVITIMALLNAVNDVYEASHFYRGQSIQGYVDLAKIFIAIIALILTVSIFTRQSPLVLLGGLGALTAVLLLVFHDTLLSFVASLQIQGNDLIKEGDWIEVPSYDADGDVLNISLHTVKVQNWDKTISVIPTYKLVETPYKNWRGMIESGGRRIKRAIHLDVNSIRFCDREMIDRYQRIDLIRDYMRERLTELDRANGERDSAGDHPLNGRQITNIGAFHAYVVKYLKSRPDLHQEGMAFLVRQLPAAPTGLPLEVYVFAKSIEWADYEQVQADIFDHLISAVREFDLRLFQQPTGMDMQSMAPQPCS